MKSGNFLRPPSWTIKAFRGPLNAFIVKLGGVICLGLKVGAAAGELRELVAPIGGRRYGAQHELGDPDVDEGLQRLAYLVNTDRDQGARVDVAAAGPRSQRW